MIIDSEYRQKYLIDTSLGAVDSFIEAIDLADSLDKILSVLQRHLLRMGFEQFTYWLMWQPDGTRASLWLTTYPEEWIKYYLENKFDSHDLVARYGAVHNRPYEWAEVKRKFNLTPSQKIVFGESAAAGLKVGGSVPIHGPGAAKAMLSVANNSSEEVFQKIFIEKRHELHLISTYAHEKIISLNLHKESKTDIKLTAREIEILTWTAKGKTRWEISRLLEISEETVKKHIENACKKLNTNNKTQATAVAIMNGLIIP